MSANQSVSGHQTVLLTTLLPSTTYTLAYCLPLLFASLLLTFAGAFLTLDRSRAFPPSYDSLPGLKLKRRLNWYLEGGIGGLVVGYVFGVHLSTFLSLMISSLTSSGDLSKKSFLAIWVLSALSATFPCGRWRYCALAAGGIVGGSTFALSVSVIIHPSLLARIVLVAIAIPLLTILIFLPIPRFQHAFLRFAMTAAGTFGVVLSISLVAGISSWGDVWERLWVADGPAEVWNNSKEKGMSAAFCFLLAAGVTCDWFLRQQFGENPDQKWDSYLAEYSQNLPDRAGHFQPLTSFWRRLFSSSSRPMSTSADEIAFPFNTDIKGQQSAPLTSPSITISQHTPAFPLSPNALRKARSQRRCTRKDMTTKARNYLKFGGNQSDSDSDPDSDLIQTPQGVGKDKFGTGRSLAGLATIDYHGKGVDVEKEMEQVKAGFAAADSLDYSDYEDDITSILKDREAADWSPEFLRRHSASGGSSTTSHRTAINEANQLVTPPGRTPLGGAVPVTPSLLKALDRLAVAQQDAFGASSPVRPGLPPSHSSEPVIMNGLPKPQPRISFQRDHKPQRWDTFWNEVRDKAAR